MTDPNSPEALKSMPFEKAMAQLNTLVAEMESGKIPLEELVKKFEEGTALANACREKLQAFERKIEILSNPSASTPEWKDAEKDLVSEPTSTHRTARKTAKPTAPEMNDPIPF